ncbi:zinc fingers and homeoboxes protein 3-like isoform X2 [Chiloscyllium plagiosum]|uniref:zinc fingers and homeoboxes protein 3-like isoform X2 n=1 Tax=Chiloscyllium plagiosum TaxID=36176 RepID=UPI001CB7C99C|nr:zinc fingers and homeoboxes protein 3-like isoform X2 [Chiloscyllium plagiosum]
MASKRKSTTPCMIPAKSLTMHEAEMDITPEYNDDDEASPQAFPVEDISANEEAFTVINNNDVTERGGFECKYCNYTSQDYHTFTVHIESEHSDASVDQLYVCVECNFSAKSQESLTVHNTLSHPNDAKLKVSVIKKNSQTVVEQSITETKNSDGKENGEEAETQSEISISKTPIMKMLKAKPEGKRITVSHAGREESNDEGGVADEAVKKTEGGDVVEVLSANGLTAPSHPVNGTAVVSVPVLQAGMAQIVPVIQRSASSNSSSSLPKVMIPLSSIPSYNAAMDSNSFLNNSFNKFPYPSKAELCWLTVVTKYPEEQLKIWFTAQRLKHGISWTPEEIEDARKNMFNTIIQSVPQQTITVLPTQVTNTNGGQHVLQANFPCQLLTQGGNIVVTQPGGIVKGATVSGTPVAVSLATLPKPQNSPKFQPQKAVGSAVGSSVKILAAPSVTGLQPGAVAVTSSHPSTTSLVSEFGTYKYKKTKEQLAALKQSFLRAQFPEHEEVDRLVRVTGLQGKEIRKWFSDRRYNYKNLKCNQAFDTSTANACASAETVPEETSTPPPPPQPAAAGPQSSPAPQARRQWQTSCEFTPPKFKGKSAEQLSALEHSYAQNPFPPEEEVDRLRVETKMTRREIDLWFSERRKAKPDDRTAKARRRADGDSGEEDEDEEDDEEEDEEEESDGEGTPSDSSSVDMKRLIVVPERLKGSPMKINVKEGLGLCVQQQQQQQPKASKASQPPGTSPPNPVKYKGQNKKTVHQLHLMKLQFMRTQWPTVEEYDELAIKSRLPRTEVVRWFGDARYALKNGQLKWYDDYKKGIYAIRSGSNSLITDLPCDGYRPKRTPSKKGGKAVLFEYYTQHRALHEEDLDRLCERSSMSYEQVRDWFAEKQTEDAMYMSDFSNEDQQSTNGEADKAEKARGALQLAASSSSAAAVEEAYSDVTDNSDNWDVPSTREGQAELNEFDAEIVSEAE